MLYRLLSNETLFSMLCFSFSSHWTILCDSLRSSSTMCIALKSSLILLVFFSSLDDFHLNHIKYQLKFFAILFGTWIFFCLWECNTARFSDWTDGQSVVKIFLLYSFSMCLFRFSIVSNISPKAFVFVISVLFLLLILLFASWFLVSQHSPLACSTKHS